MVALMDIAGAGGPRFGLYRKLISLFADSIRGAMNVECRRSLRGSDRPRT
jgi:hypothetical protein